MAPIDRTFGMTPSWNASERVPRPRIRAAIAAAALTVSRPGAHASFPSAEELRAILDPVTAGAHDGDRQSE